MTETIWKKNVIRVFIFLTHKFNLKSVFYKTSIKAKSQENCRNQLFFSSEIDIIGNRFNSGSDWDLDIVYLPVFLGDTKTIPKQFGRPEA